MPELRQLFIQKNRHFIPGLFLIGVGFVGLVSRLSQVAKVQSFEDVVESNVAYEILVVATNGFATMSAILALMAVPLFFTPIGDRLWRGVAFMLLFLLFAPQIAHLLSLPTSVPYVDVIRSEDEELARKTACEHRLVTPEQCASGSIQYEVVLASLRTDGLRKTLVKSLYVLPASTAVFWFSAGLLFAKLRSQRQTECDSGEY